MTPNKTISTSFYALLDLLVALVCAYYSPQVTNLISPCFNWQPEDDFNILTTTPFIAGAAVVGVPIVLRVVGFYRRGNLQRISSAIRQLFTFMVYYLCILAFYQSLRSQVGYLYMNHVIVVNIVLIPICLFFRYYICRWLLLHTPAKHKSLNHVLLVGSEKDIREGWDTLPSFWTNNLHVSGKIITGVTSPQELQGIIESSHISQLILFGGLDAYHHNAEVLTICELQGIDIYINLKGNHAVNMRADINDIGEEHMLILSSTPEYSWARMIKGFADRLLAIIALICSSPLWLVAAIGIKISDPKGPIFFRQQRSGLYGKPFTMWKFRSMYADAEERLEEVKKTLGNEMSGPIFKLSDDPRIFPFGKFIRKFSIDELPQLLNIVTGDMSIVGPRPLPVYETKEIPNIAQRRRLSVKPGLTCYWQVEDRSNNTSFVTMVEKDLKYIDNWSLWLDIKLIFRTVPAVLLGRGAK